MSDITVTYNGNALTPTPLVQQNVTPIDFGTRWGNVQEIEIQGFITGLTGNPTSIQPTFAQKFSGQFGTLEVAEGASTMYKWSNIVVDEITFPQNPLYIAQGTGPKSMTPYSVKMRAINVPSGVLDPVNEYSFQHSDDGLVTVVHKVSARGIKTQNGGLQNAINFVTSFSGQNPFSSPLNAILCPTGSGVLISYTENVDRANCSYGIQETYKYNSGLSQPFIETWGVTISDLFDNEWLTLDVDWKIQGSPVNNNLSVIESGKYINDPKLKLGVLGYETGNLIASSSNISRDSGAASIQIRTTYLSGYNSADLSGYFDYTVSLSNDLVYPMEDWRIEGDFVCFGPRDWRVSRLNAFKTASGAGDWKNLLTGLIIASPLYAYHGVGTGFGGHATLDIHENTGLAVFHASLSTTDGQRPQGIYYPKYTIDCQPNKWIFDLLPSANIEGHYVLQDFQMMSQAKMTISVDCQAVTSHTSLPTLSGYLDTLTSIYITPSFTTTEASNTGLLDITMHREMLGIDKVASGVIFNKVAGSVLLDFVRQSGFMFGY